jgi:molybdopterin-guanine dinucleotide biosynthesis protein A
MVIKKPKDLAFAILIGGKSSKFNTEKIRFKFENKSLILHLIEVVSNFDEEVFLISSSEDQLHSFRKEINFPGNIKFFFDDREYFPYPKIHSPILGVYTALKELNNLGFEKVLILSGESPLIKKEVIRLLIDASITFDCTIPKWKNGFLEPLFAIYPIEKTLKIARENLIKKEFNLNHLLDETWNINFISVEDSIQPLDKNLLSLININGPIDIEKLLKFYK